MQRATVLTLVLAFAASARAEPDLRRVVLSSGGVGQFEFAGDVEGPASLTLDVPLDQVDDVLKRLVVDDPAGPSDPPQPAFYVSLPGLVPGIHAVVQTRCSSRVATWWSRSETLKRRDGVGARNKSGQGDD